MDISFSSTPSEWYQFLADDTFEFSKTQKALTPLILKVVQQEIKDESQWKVLQDLLLGQIKTAADRYLENFNDTISYTFPTYFT